ncbi:MAG: hypothetical protein D6731_18715 [Planctomycetota bacterium]|nr:MAG: hypothetical protein D6731_18715 [Planctomycetota bacterium]
MVAWGSLGTLALADALARRRAGPASAPAPGRSRASAWGLAAVALAVALARCALALTRAGRSVDEAQYAALAAFLRANGESLFSWPWNLHAHQVLYLFGSLERPFGVADAATSLAIGATGFLLACTLRETCRPAWLAWAAAPLYAYALLRYEGLSSNKEPWVNLCVAGYLWLRVGLAGRGRAAARQALAGACLGAAVVCKEQAVFLVAVEPLLAGWEASRSAGNKLRAFLRALGLALAGGLVPLGALLAGFALHGVLGDYLSFLWEWGTSGGEPLAAFAAADPLPADLAVAPLPLPLRLLDGLLPLLASAVGLLGTAGLLRALAEAPRLEPTGEERLRVAALALGLCGLVAVSVGLRWSGHYWMLLAPALLPLALLRLRDALHELRRREHRWVAGALLAWAVATAAVEAVALTRPLGRIDAEGGGPRGAEREALERVAAWTAARTRPSERIFVWGWRPELYLLARRAPASRYVGGATAGPAQVALDLARTPPALVLRPPPPGWPDDPLAAWRDPFALRRHPWLKKALAARGFIPVAGPDELWGWTAWAPVPASSEGSPRAAGGPAPATRGSPTGAAAPPGRAPSGTKAR